MIILADKNIDHRIIKAIGIMGILIESVYFTKRGLSDKEIAALSLHPPKIILTEDKDFGEMIFKEGVTDLSIILLRYLYKDVHFIIEKLKWLLTFQSDMLFNHFTTATIHKIRTRKL